MKGILLKFGKLLPLGANGHHSLEFTGDLESFARGLGERLRVEHLQQLQEIDSLEVFLRTFPLDYSTTNSSTLLIYGVAKCLAGGIDVGGKLLEGVIDAPVVDAVATQILQIKALAAAHLAELAQGRSVFLRAIEACERNNIKDHFAGCGVAPDFGNT
jgi:hypothetical protein